MDEAEAEAASLDNFDERVAELRRRLLSAREGPAPNEGSSRRMTPGQRSIETAGRHERGRERGRRRRRDRSRSRSSDESVFGDAPSAGSAMGADALRLRAEQTPGLLWQKALSEIQQYLGQRGVSLPQRMQEPSNFVTYLTAILSRALPAGEDRPSELARTAHDCRGSRRAGERQPPQDRGPLGATVEGGGGIRQEGELGG